MLIYSGILPIKLAADKSRSDRDENDGYNLLFINHRMCSDDTISRKIICIRLMF